jgi:hypothetical protein
MGVRVPVDGLTFYVLHDEIRETIFRCAAIEKAAGTGAAGIEGRGHHGSTSPELGGKEARSAGASAVRKPRRAEELHFWSRSPRWTGSGDRIKR